MRQVSSCFALAIVAFVIVVPVALPTDAAADSFPKHVTVQAALGEDPRDTGGGRARTADLLIRLVTQDGSVVYYRELHCDVPVIGRDGRVEIELGTVDPAVNPLDIDFREAYWLSVVECPDESACANAEPGFCDGAELQRVPLAAVGYAYRALHADETDRALYADDCDRLDGLHASDFMPAGTDLWVDAAGDTMAGPLTLSADPTLPLEAATKQYADRPRPDLSVPAGYSILGDTPSPPAGYTYTGQQVLDSTAWRTLGELPDEVTAGHAVECGGLLWVAAGDLLLSYDETARAWASRTSLPLRDYPLDFGMASAGGRIYVIGGREERGSVVDWNYEYDPAANVWTRRAPLPRARTRSVAAAVDGRVHIIGGFDDANSHVDLHHEYDPAADTWRVRASMSLAGSAATVLDGKIYVVGTSVRGSDPPHDQLRVHDVASGLWSTGPRLPADVVRPGIAALDGHVYVFHGGDSNWGGAGWTGWGGGEAGDTFVLDVAAGQWSAGTPEPASRWQPSAATVGRTIHVVGGLKAATNDVASFVHDAFTPPGRLFVHRRN